MASISRVIARDAKINTQKCPIAVSCSRRIDEVELSINSSVEGLGDKNRYKNEIN